MPNVRKDTTNDQTSSGPPRKLRTACDMCHQTKVKCTGGPRCDECAKLGITCKFSTSDRIGRPKGARNKSTMDRIRNYEAQTNIDVADHVSQETSTNSADLGDAVTYQGSENPLDVADAFGTPWRSNSMMGNDSIGPFRNDQRSTVSNALGSDIGTIMPESMFMPMEMSSGLDLSSPQPQMSASSSSNLLAMPSSFTSSFYQPDSFFQARQAQSPWSFDVESSDQTVSDQSGCSCVGKLSELLCQIKESAKRHQVMPVDLVLLHADQVLESSAQMLDCRSCRQNLDHDILLLSAINMRILTRNFGEVLKQIEAGKAVGGFSAGLGPSKSVSSQGDGTDGHTRRHSQSVKINAEEGSSLRIGRFQITGPDNKMLLDFVLLRTLAKFRVMLGRLREHCIAHPQPSLHPATSEMRHIMYDDGTLGMALGHHDSSNADHLKSLLNSIEATIDVLTQRLRVERGATQ